MELAMPMVTVTVDPVSEVNFASSVYLATSVSQPTDVKVCV